MKTTIVRIGNSKGIRLPKAILEQCRLEGVVELEVEGDHLVIRAADSPRAGWDAAFTEMAKNRQDELLDAASYTQWDKTEWEW